MTEKDQMAQLLIWLAQEQGSSYQKVLEYCLNRKIVANEEELREILSTMQEKDYISFENNMLSARLTAEEAKGLTMSEFSRVSLY